ncbi:TAXI family TRAP transporter solute-binding subunit [Psychromonas aquatilis]|uniref:TAXI family TRAP transporter solute-binding subunit n=1 Tax=Psychromonas aquatilis TaxID=2005072 RepID=A0ABU9GRV9_9GAMM
MLIKLSFSTHLKHFSRALLDRVVLPVKPLSILCLLSLYQANVSAKVEYVAIGTGGLTGVYYPTGGAICYLVNQVNKTDNIRCEIKSTPGSIYNLNALKSKDIDVAVVQSDWQNHAYYGSTIFKEQGPFKKLRSLFSVHSEPFTVLATEDADISFFEDIRGKRVNFGVENSGQRATMDVLLDLYGWDTSDFSEVTELRPNEQAQALCDKKIDVIVYVVGHPNSSIKEATSACNTKLVNVEGEKINKLINTYPYYEPATIPGNIYKDNPEDTSTFGVGATVVTTSDLPDDVAYQMVKAVFENHEKFSKLHPSFKGLTKKSMVTKYLTAPLHPGALKYYKEIGLLE